MPSRRLIPRGSSFAITFSLDRIRLPVGGRVLECWQREAALFDAEQKIVLGDVDAEPARGRQLRYETTVRDRRRVAHAKRTRGVAHDTLERDEAVGDEVPRPRN